jgi:chromosome segregation ATPase
MKILKLKFENFKGIKELEIPFNGVNTSILGDNETGKTTVMDSICWVFYDKDSLNSAQFDIKPLDKSGEPRHGIDTSVEVVLGFDEKEVVLKKVYSEKWTKKRGSSKKIFSGHTTDYFIDEVPVKQKDYKAFIGGICDEERFKLITNPRYFNEEMHWTKRRELLLLVCGNISDQDVIDSKKDLKDLADIISKRSIEDHKKMIESQRRDINKELEKIPVRIDEAERTIVRVEGNEKDIQKNIDSLERERSNLNGKLTLIQSGSRETVIRENMSNIKNLISDIERKVEGEKSKLYDQKRYKISRLESDIYRAKGDRELSDRQLKSTNVEIKGCETQIETMRSMWHKENDKEFKFEQEDKCPTCGQYIPQSQLEGAKEKALERFNFQKAENLAEISSSGKALSERVKGLQAKAAILEADVNTHVQNILKIDSELSEAMGKTIQEVKYPAEYNDHCKRLEELEAQLSSSKLEIEGPVAEIKSEIQEIDSEISKCKSELLVIEAGQRTKTRIKNLKENEKTLAKEYERLEGELFLIEEFIRTKVSMLNKKINSKFKLARFKLFETQVNEGIKECCEVTYGGVPYRSLNNAMRINIGLDICETISKHYGVELPVIIDNAEAVTNVYKTTSQQIKLVVVKGQNTLRIEHEE